MFAKQTVQVAVLVALHSRVLTRGRIRFPDRALERYWAASKCRQERWLRWLKQYGCDSGRHRHPPEGPPVNPCEAILNEVLVTEILSRVWAAICQASDRIRKSEDAGPVADSVFAGHLDARHRVLNFMVYGYGISVAEAVDLNRRRLASERCSDMLLGCLEVRDASKYAFEPSRVIEWTRSLRQVGRIDGRSTLFALASQQFNDGRNDHAGNVDLNQEIANSILACVPPALFGGLGSLLGPLHLSLLQAAPDSAGRLSLDLAHRGQDHGVSTQGRFRNGEEGKR